MVMKFLKKVLIEKGNMTYRYNDPAAYVVYEYDRIDHESYIRMVYLDKTQAEKEVALMNQMRYNDDYEYQIQQVPLITKKEK